MGRGKEVMACFHSEKERAQFTTGPAKVRRDTLGWKDSTVQEVVMNFAGRSQTTEENLTPSPKKFQNG